MTTPDDAPLSDADVEALLRQRVEARKRSDYEEADRIRSDLLWRGIVSEDEDSRIYNTEDFRWKRMPLDMVRCGACGCLAWLKRKEEFCGQPVVEGGRAYFCQE